ncbi:uncharacterized protein LOC134251415 [Saccostrea cucullata]|uniref:uncharacterized protein LOC134251415 n=1 Tax=Saccostrea cuccullata TaxID=36930 RepID=UPI002ED5BE18
MKPKKIKEKFLILCLGFMCLVKYSNSRKWSEKKSNANKNFVSVRYNSFRHERELRIAFKGIFMLETTAFLDSIYETKLHQITDGSKLIQTVYQNGVIKDCEFSVENATILQFVQDFANDSNIFYRKEQGDVFSLYNSNARDTNSSALVFFRRRKFLQNFRDLIKIRHDIKLCHKIANKIKRSHRLPREELIPVYDVETSPTNDRGGTKRSRRRKRSSLFASFLMYPGTKWCGRGQLATEYDDLGEDNELDVCCRDHDLCHHIIEPFTKKFHYFNFRFHAVLHCKCDQEFRHCLQQSLSPNANFLGKIYFNIMGSKCFVFKETSVCKAYTWYGTCAEYKTDTVAHIKTQPYFT